MKTTVLTLFTGLILFPLTNTKAQLVPVINEDFDNNEFGWNESDNEDGKFYVKEGFYFLELRKESGGRTSTFKQYVDPDKDWKLETTITQISGRNNYGWGVIFGGLPTINTFYLFQVACDGHVQLAQYQDNKFSKITDWIQSKAVNPIGKENYVVIENRKKKTYFYINGKEVYKCDALKLKGTKFGFHPNTTMTLKVDNYRLYTEKKEINLAQSADVPVKKTNLGTGVNTIYDEVSPVISPNDKVLYFISKDNPRNLGEKDKEDAWYTIRNDDGSWSEAKQMDAPINNDNNNAVSGVSAGGNSLLLNNRYFRDNTMSKGLSISYKTREGWSFPENLNIIDYSNEDENSTRCWSVGENIILLSVQTKEYFENGHDIYVTFKQKDNTWSKPQNLGKDINTFGYEGTPFLSPDNKTLYFSSDAHPGYGNRDIFVTKRLDNSWTKWSKPKNLGPYINTEKSDMYFTISASGKHAFVVSRDNSIGKGDIFELELQEEVRPEPVILVKGNVYDKETSSPLEANISIHELGTDKLLGEVRSDPETGYYEVILPKGTEYGFYAEKELYYSIRENLEVGDTLSEYLELQQDLYLSPIVIGSRIQLNNIFFVQSKAVILEKSWPELDKLVEVLTANNKLNISIEGHTDNVGSADANQKLSEERAEKIYDYLVDKGISKKRLSFVGYGGTKPLVPNTSESMRKKNRRVEFVVVK